MCQLTMKTIEALKSFHKLDGKNCKTKLLLYALPESQLQMKRAHLESERKQGP